MKKTMMMIVNATMAVIMVTAGYTLADKMMGETETASVAYAETTTTQRDYSVASVVEKAKRIAAEPAVTEMGPITIDGESWRYTAKTVDGQITVEVYEWGGIGTLFGEVSSAIA